MTNIVVVYQSKYGATKKYAEWIAGEIGCEAVQRKHCTDAMLAAKDIVLYGGGIYATGVAGLNFAKKIAAQQSKKLIVFAVGASPFDEACVKEVRAHNMKGELGEIPFYYLRGSFDEGVMTTGDRMLIGMLKRMVLKKDPSTYEVWERALMASIGKTADWTDIRSILPIVGKTRELQGLC